MGTEDILMKRIIGHQLSDVWNDMSQAQRFGLVRSLVAIEAKLVETEMPGYGSLYYRDDLQLTDRSGLMGEGH